MKMFYTYSDQPKRFWQNFSGHHCWTSLRVQMGSVLPGSMIPPLLLILLPQSRRRVLLSAGSYYHVVFCGSWWLLPLR